MLSGKNFKLQLLLAVSDWCVKSIFRKIVVQCARLFKDLNCLIKPWWIEIIIQLFETSMCGRAFKTVRIDCQTPDLRKYCRSEMCCGCLFSPLRKKRNECWQRFRISNYNWFRTLVITSCLLDDSDRDCDVTSACAMWCAMFDFSGPGLGG